MNDNRKIEVVVGQAFAGSRPNIESSTLKVTGYGCFADHPLLHPTKPKYQFERKALNLLFFAWTREIENRADTAPRRGIWFGGPKGAGKTTIVEQFFARLGVPVFPLTCNRRIPLSDYLVKMVPDGEGGWLQIDGPLLTAMKEGFPVVLNEPGAMDPADLTAMNDIIDRGIVVLDNGEVVRARRGFHVYATDNSMGLGDETGAYAGVNTMNAATMSRFYKFEMKYSEPEEELRILQGEFPEQRKDALEKFVQFTNLMREPYLKGMSSFTIGTRELIDWIDVTSTMQDALEDMGENAVWFGLNTVVALSQTERAAAKGVFKSVFGIDLGNA